MDVWQSSLLVPNTQNLVFSGFNQQTFSQHQAATRNRSCLRSSSPPLISLLENETSSLESSTYDSTLHVLQTNGRSLMHKLKRKSPRMHQWRTPCFRPKVLEMELLLRTCCFLCVRKLSNHARATPEAPQLYKQFLMIDIVKRFAKIQHEDSSHLFLINGLIGLIYMTTKENTESFRWMTSPVTALMKWK